MAYLGIFFHFMFLLSQANAMNYCVCDANPVLYTESRKLWFFHFKTVLRSCHPENGLALAGSVEKETDGLQEYFEAIDRIEEKNVCIVMKRKPVIKGHRRSVGAFSYIRLNKKTGDQDCFKPEYNITQTDSHNKNEKCVRTREPAHWAPEPHLEPTPGLFPCVDFFLSEGIVENDYDCFEQKTFKHGNSEYIPYIEPAIGTTEPILYVTFEFFGAKPGATCPKDFTLTTKNGAKSYMENYEVDVKHSKNLLRPQVEALDQGLTNTETHLLQKMKTVTCGGGNPTQ